ncbi:12496_t:CDS:1, partial [Racocetra persica]
FDVNSNSFDEFIDYNEEVFWNVQANIISYAESYEESLQDIQENIFSHAENYDQLYEEFQG